jgi:hypothetical protein
MHENSKLKYINTVQRYTVIIHTIMSYYDLRVLKVQVSFEYQSPSSIIPKKNGTVRVVSDFRVLNSKLQQVSYPIPRIQDILISLNSFTYTMSIDLNMGYYAIRFTPISQKL